MAVSSALLWSAARSIPRALGAELRFSSRPTGNAPRRLYGAAATATTTAGPQGPQPNKTAQKGYLAEKGMSPEAMSYVANMDRVLDKLDAKVERLSALLKEREEQEKRYARWTLGMLMGLIGVTAASALARKQLNG